MYGALWLCDTLRTTRSAASPVRVATASRIDRCERLEEPAQVEPDERDALAVGLEDDRRRAERIPDLGDRREQAEARRRPERLGDVATGETGPQRHRVSSDGSKRSDEPVGCQPRTSLAGVVSRQRVLFSEIASKIPNLTSAGADRQLIDHLDRVLLGEEAREVPDEHRPVLLEDGPEPDDQHAHRRRVGEPACGRLAEQLGRAVRAVGTGRRPVVEQVPGGQVALAGRQPTVRQAVVPFPAAHRAAGAHHDDAPDGAELRPRRAGR